MVDDFRLQVCGMLDERQHPQRPRANLAIGVTSERRHVGEGKRATPGLDHLEDDQNLIAIAELQPVGKCALAEHERMRPQFIRENGPGQQWRPHRKREHALDVAAAPARSQRVARRIQLNFRFRVFERRQQGRHARTAGKLAQIGDGRPARGDSC